MEVVSDDPCLSYSHTHAHTHDPHPTLTLSTTPTKVKTQTFGTPYPWCARSTTLLRDRCPRVTVFGSTPQSGAFLSQEPFHTPDSLSCCTRSRSSHVLDSVVDKLKGLSLSLLVFPVQRSTGVCSLPPQSVSDLEWTISPRFFGSLPSQDLDL